MVFITFGEPPVRLNSSDALSSVKVPKRMCPRCRCYVDARQVQCTECNALFKRYQEPLSKPVWKESEPAG